MKKIIILSALAVMMSASAMAQSVKVAKINSSVVMESLAETDSAKVKLENVAKELSAQLETMQVEANNKVEDYQKKKGTYSPAIDIQKQKEIVDLQRKLQEFNQAAENDYVKAQGELFNPILTKINNAIKDIAKASGYTVVYDEANAQAYPAYVDDAVVSITTQVVKKLGGVIKATPVSAAPAK